MTTEANTNNKGSRDGAVVGALASPGLLWPGFDSGPVAYVG